MGGEGRLRASTRAQAMIAAAALVVGLVPGVSSAGPARIGRSAALSSEAGDAVVVAVVDFNFSPYHWDFLASKMPQSKAGRRLPLHRAPHKWLPGFPNPKKAFSSYNRLSLDLGSREADRPFTTPGGDQPKWQKVKPSTKKKVNYYWLPDTKVIGAVEFGSNRLVGTPNDHGVGVTSVSVGNLHGTCPECLLVFVNIDNGQEAEALRWALNQPWIDVVTNSYGHGVAKTYNGPEVADGLRASRRGQTVFFSAGNGVENAYTAPNSTYHSSEKGVDWFVTVGAVSPGSDNHYEKSRTVEHGSYFGAGKPVDVAGIGMDYPSAYGAATIGATGNSGFSGTSNAAPTVAGHYARALYKARRALSGASRVQRNGMIARGGGVRCGGKRRSCELGNGTLTAQELRTRLLKGAVHSEAGMTTYAGGAVPVIGEDEFANEGHGMYRGRETGKKKVWEKEFARIVAPLFGRAKELKRPQGERQWMIVDSYCRQQVWGSWDGGYYKEGKTELPGPDPDYPLRSLLEAGCPAMLPPP